MGTAADRYGVRVQAWQTSDGSHQWVRATLGTQGPAWIWRRGTTGLDVFWELSETSVDSTVSNWVATATGLLHERAGRWERLDLGDGDHPANIRQIASNLEGGIWAATESDGLWLVMPKLIQTLTRHDGLPSEQIASLALDPQGRLIGGAEGYGKAFRLNEGANHPVTAFEDLFGPVHTVDSKGVIWSSSESFSRYFELDSAKPLAFVLHSGRGRPTGWVGFSQILAPPDQSLWLVSDHGIYRLHKRPEAHEEPEIHSDRYSLWPPSLRADIAFRGIVLDSEGAAWVGSVGGGLFRIQGDRVENFGLDDGLVSRNCAPVHRTGDGTLWLASDSGLGIRRHGQFKNLRLSDGLPEARILAVEEAAGHLWLAGTRGIHGIRRDEVEDFLMGRTNRVHPFTLGLNDGLLTTQFPTEYQPIMVKTPNGRLWVATARGLSSFQPEEVLKELHPPPVKITGLTAMGRLRTSSAKSQTLVLPPGHGEVVEIAFNSVSFVDPDRVTFQYRLQGGDSPVNGTVAEPRAVFTNLRPGSYSFQVAAFCDDGVTTEKPASLRFEVMPYFYETPHFKALGTLGGLALVGGLVGWRVHRVRREAAREQELQLHQVRQHIARDMHDELGAELTRLTFGNGPNAPPGDPSGNASDQTARGLLRSLDETVWLVNPTKDSLTSAVSYLERWTRDYFAGTPVQLTVDLPPAIPDRRVSSEWRLHLLRAVKEGCNNILKHSRATRAEFRLKFGNDSPTLEWTLLDNGCGFEVREDAEESDPGQSRREQLGGNGLDNLRRRAGELGGTLEIQSAPGQGTRIRFRLPLPSA